MSDSTADAANYSLFEDFRRTSRKVHNVSNSIVNARLIVLFTDRQLYARALGCFWAIFKTLEECIAQHKEHPDFKPFASVLTEAGGLFRTKGFEKDLEYFLGPTWREQLQISPALAAYQAHMRALAASEQPGLLLAHAFTQHLAMASGGQIIRRQARKRMGLPEEEGTWAFEYEGSPNAMKHEFKEALDALGRGLSEEMRQKMLSEHVRAFEFNNSVMRSFRIGWLAFFAGLLRLVTPGARTSFVILVPSVVALSLYSKMQT